MKLSVNMEFHHLSTVTKEPTSQVKLAPHYVLIWELNAHKPAYCSQGNGQFERFKRTLEGMLAKVVKDNQRDWNLRIPRAPFAYRTEFHRLGKRVKKCQSMLKRSVNHWSLKEVYSDARQRLEEEQIDIRQRCHCHLPHQSLALCFCSETRVNSHHFGVDRTQS